MVAGAEADRMLQGKLEAEQARMHAWENIQADVRARPVPVANRASDLPKSSAAARGCGISREAVVPVTAHRTRPGCLHAVR